jgi:hypothetical protein
MEGCSIRQDYLRGDIHYPRNILIDFAGKVSPNGGELAPEGMLFAAGVTLSRARGRPWEELTD